MEKALVPRLFLLLVLALIVYLCYLVFKPFLDEMVVAAILVTIFYPWYEKIVKFLRGRKVLASLITCFLIVLIVIIPFIYFAIYTGKQVIAIVPELTVSLQNTFSTKAIHYFTASKTIKQFKLSIQEIESLQALFIKIIGKAGSKLTDWIGNFLSQATSFFVSIPIIIFTMFFFFMDGRKMLHKLMLWTPLPNKYDREIFKKFHDVSSSTIVSTFVTAIAQGFVGAIGFAIIGLPASVFGILIGFCSLLPYVGSSIVWLPVSVYLLVTHQIWQAVFLLIWGVAVISTVDNLVRGFIIKGKAQVHPIFVIFSILGGMSLFGFWGVFFGPLIIALAVTILHIYEMEYGGVLEKD